jgi:tight adherence protein B
MLTVAIAAGLTVAAAVFGVARMVATPRVRVQGRLAEMVESRPYQREAAILNTRASRIPFVDALVHWRGGVEETRLQLERAGISLRVGEYRVLRILIAGGAMVLGFFVGEATGTPVLSWVGAIVGLAVGAVLPALYVGFRVNRRKARIDTQLVEFCEVMGSMLRSGYGYLQALSATAERLEEPLSNALTVFIDAVELGGDVDDELQRMSERLGSDDFEMIATAITIQRRSGGNLAELLEGVAVTIRDRQAFAREILALTSEERFSAVILAAFPLFLGLILGLLLPETYGLLITDPRGRMILALILVMDAIGYFAVKRLIKITV